MEAAGELDERVLLGVGHSLCPFESTGMQGGCTPHHSKITSLETKIIFQNLKPSCRKTIQGGILKKATKMASVYSFYTVTDSYVTKIFNGSTG